jgi:F0F1-type ATP synthase gamma subunit
MARITSEIPPADDADVAGADMTHLIVPITSDRGLCGGVNTQVIRAARRPVYVCVHRNALARAHTHTPTHDLTLKHDLENAKRR